MKRPLVLLACAAMTFYGCATIPSHQLSKSQAVEIARRIGAEHGENLRAFHPPDTTFEPRAKMWIVSFTEKQPYRYESADGFAVTIDDETGRTQYYEHIWK
jgi:hypothetical protein